MLPLDPKITDIIALAAAGVAVLALVATVVVAARLRRLRRALVVLQGDGDHRSFLHAVEGYVAEVDGLRAHVSAAQAELAALRGDIGDALRHVAVVRYDAFQDMGGRMSFSAALLDDAGDGLVLTAINGRSETRAYAKGVKEGDSEHLLSPEEQQAVTHALRGVRSGADGQEGRRAARA